MSILGDIIILQVAFGQEGIRIEFMEQRFQTENGGVESGLVLHSLDEDQVAMIVEIQAALVMLVENYYENLPDRNRPDTMPENRFLRKKGDEDDGEGAPEDEA